MTRRTKQLFSLSLLDLLTSALGAVIFLFIITPKGGESPAKVRQASVFFDTTQMKIYGDLPDSLLTKSSGDTLLSILVAYKDLPKPKKADIPKKRYVYNEPRPKPKVEEPVKKPPKPKAEKPETKPKPKPKPEPVKKPEPKPQPAPPKPPVYRGDAPSVPCAVSFEISWDNKEDNVDLFVCRDNNNCVYGGRKKDRDIGQWDSGKSRNRLFGNDLRTNQEAVRQFDGIIPGEYRIYAQFKNSQRNSTSVRVNGLIYTKAEDGQERGESFSRTLKIGDDRVHLGTILLKEDGSYVFNRP